MPGGNENGVRSDAQAPVQSVLLAIQARPPDEAEALRRALAIGCVAREPLSVRAVARLARVGAGAGERVAEVLGPLLVETPGVGEGEVALSPASEGVRALVLEQLAGEQGGSVVTAAHRALGEWPPVVQGLRGYVLRHGVRHLLLAGDSKGAERLGLHAATIACRVRELGPTAARESVIEDEQALSDDPANKLDLAPWRELLALLGSEALRIQRSPLAAVSLFRERLVALGWDEKKIARALGSSPDAPRLARIQGGSAGAMAGGGGGHSAEVRGCALRADGKRAVTASADGTLKIWDADTGREIATLEGHSAAVNACALLPDGETVVSGSDDGTVRLWKKDSATGLFTPAVFKDHVSPSPDEDTPTDPLLAGEPTDPLLAGEPTDPLLAASDSMPVDPLLSEGDIPDDPLLADDDTGDGMKEQVYAVGLDAGGQRIFHAAFTPGVGTLWIEGEAAEEPAMTVQSFLWTNASAASDDPGEDAEQLQAMVGDLIREEEPSAPGPDHEAAVDRLRVEQDKLWERSNRISADLVATAEALARASGAGEPTEELQARLQAILTDKESLREEEHRVRSELDRASAQQDAAFDAQMKSTDTAIQELLRLEEERESAAAGRGCSRAFAVSPSEQIVVAAEGPRLLVLETWRFDSEAPPAVLEGHTGPVTACAISPDGQRLFSASTDCTLRVWDLPRRKLIASTHVGTSPLTGLAMSPGGRHLLSTSAEGVSVWDAAGPFRLESYPGTAPFGCVAAAGGRVVAGDFAGQTWMFHLRDPESAGRGTVLATGPVRRRHALLVGVRGHESPALAELPYASNDVRELSGVLEEHGYHVVSLHDERPEPIWQPARENIRDALSLLRLDADDMLLVYFSCHGVRLESGRAHLVARDSDPEQLAETTLAVDEIVARMTATGARRLILVLDACYAGVGLLGRGGDGPAVSAEVLAPAPPEEERPPEPARAARSAAEATAERDAFELAEGFALLAASSAGERSYDRKTVPHSLFTSLVIEGLRGKADVDRKGFVSVDDLKTWLLSGTAALVRAETKLNQTPTFQIQGKGDMVLARLPQRE
ncbi:MAG: caspase family protein [Polyangiaceae bacterium]